MFQVDNYFKICFIILQKQLMRSGFQLTVMVVSGLFLPFFKTTGELNCFLSIISVERVFGSASSLSILFLNLVLPREGKLYSIFEILLFSLSCYSLHLPRLPILINCSVTDGRKGLA